MARRLHERAPEAAHPAASARADALREYHGEWTVSCGRRHAHALEANLYPGIERHLQVLVSVRSPRFGLFVLFMCVGTQIYPRAHSPTRHYGTPSNAIRDSKQCLHLLLCRWCSQMLAPPHSLHLLLCRWCWQMLTPSHSLHWLLERWCWQMLAPPHTLHLFLMRRCRQMLAPPHSLHLLRSRWRGQMLAPPHR